MRTRPDRKWPGKYSRFVLSKSIRNLLSFLVIVPPKSEKCSSLRCPRGGRRTEDGQLARARLRHRGFTLTEYTRRGTRRSSLLLPRVTSWCEVRITGLHRIGNTFVTWHASLSLSLSFAISLLPASVPATIPRYTSSSRLPRPDRARSSPSALFADRGKADRSRIPYRRPPRNFLSPFRSSRRTFLPILGDALTFAPLPFLPGCSSPPPPVQSGPDWSHLPGTRPMAVF